MSEFLLIAQLTAVTIRGGQVTSNAPRPTAEQAVAVLRFSHSPYDRTGITWSADRPRVIYLSGRPEDGPFGSFPAYEPIAPLSHNPYDYIPAPLI